MGLMCSRWWGITWQRSALLSSLLVFICIYLCRSDGLYNGRTKTGNVVENLISHFQQKQQLPVAPQNNTWPMQASSPEICSSRSMSIIQWQCECCRALTKCLKQSNEKVDKKQLEWHTISNHRTVKLIITYTSRRHPKYQICPNFTN